MRRIFLAIIGRMMFAGCATQRPVLYPNEQLRRVGTAVADRDIDDCMRRVENYVSPDGGGA